MNNVEEEGRVQVEILIKVTQKVEHISKEVCYDTVDTLLKDIFENKLATRSVQLFFGIS